ncbi:hypothetical protein RQP46_004599 [Phenoliferia psychrophenolica]
MGRPEGSRFGGAAALLVLSVAFHLIYLGSIFDIYFRSPVTPVPIRYGVGAQLEHGGPGGQVGEALAKRVVLIVGDGLRADKLFQTYPSPPFPSADPLPAPLDPLAPHATVASAKDANVRDLTTPAPFIRNLIQSHQASWGVSHTRVPTESRPGHVALIGGMYEDVSAVTRGWQANPVAFDSVFNQSTHTFSFGSPDILPMFKDGAKDPTKVDAFSYGEEYEDFSSDAVALDLWVLDQLKTLLLNSTQPGQEGLKSTLHGDGTVFFLHLLGLDTTGHSYRPHGPEYHRNIRVVDWVVEETVKVLDEYYGGDGKTAFVFTADHGMSAKGNHGDGEPDNTRTPLVAWGAGVSEGGSNGGHDEYSEEWGLEGQRKDVEQADVAVLMSVLAGLSIPANSAGRVPLGYLDASPSFKARAALANAKQILAEFTVKSDTKESHSISFRPYAQLVDSPSTGTKSVASHLAAIEAMIAEGRYHDAEESSIELVRLGLQGLRYFQTYDWFILRTIVTIGYLGFMSYSTNFVLQTHVFASQSPSPSSPSFLGPSLALASFAALATRFAIERAPITYYLYAFFPSFFWGSLLRDPWAIRLLVTAVKQHASPRLGVSAVLVGLTLELMVYGYMRREVFAAIVGGMGIVWPMVGMTGEFRSRNKSVLGVWAGACVVLAGFPLLPVEKGESLPVVMAGGVSFIVLAYSALARTQSSATLARTTTLVQAELLLTLGSMVVTWSSARGLQLKQGLPLLNQLAGWAILVSSTLIPAIHGRPLGQPFFERLLVLLTAFGPAFVILSLSYEGLFYSAFCVALYTWLVVESRLAESMESAEEKEKDAVVRIDAGHVRIALFFLTFLHVAFFGVGNVASISSFYLEPVYRLIPVFMPFPMALLLLFKLLTPFVALSGISSVLNHRLRLPPFALFIIAATLSDALALNFFFLVSDEGSWLEIGSTISNYAICALLHVFNTGLFLLGESVLEGTTV